MRHDVTFGHFCKREIQRGNRPETGLKTGQCTRYDSAPDVAIAIRIQSLIVKSPGLVTYLSHVGRNHLMISIGRHAFAITVPKNSRPLENSTRHGCSGYLHDGSQVESVRHTDDMPNDGARNPNPRDDIDQ